LRIWEYNPPPSSLVKKFKRELRVSEIIAELVARLGYVDTEEARAFLYPKLGEIQCPFQIANLEEAAGRISQAISNRQRIAVCGDYDVDGVTSTSLLVAVLQLFDNYPSFVVPLRLEEGYGLSQKAAERAMGGGADLFIALDCGTNSVEVGNWITDQGCDLIIIDHHQSKDKTPEKAILVNPHVHDCADAHAVNLCTVGLVFKLAHGLLKIRREQGDERAFKIKLRTFLDFVAMGTLADLVPLREENRTFARIGLQVLAKTEREGLKSLMKVAGIHSDHGVKPVDISFKIGPRINASGRLADAAVAVELMLSEDKAFSMETSLQLDSFNRERQDIERAITDNAIEQIKTQQADASGLVVLGENWHPGVVGIVASRVSKAFNRPAIVLGAEGGMAKGSGRSISGVNLVEVLTGFSETLGDWGGHPMAVGVSIPLDRVDVFREQFDKAVKEFLATHDLDTKLEVCAYMDLEDVGPRFMDELALMEPFGQENPEPKFASKNVVFRQRPSVFKDAHFRFTLQDKRGRSVQGVAWKMADRIPEVGTPVDIVYRLVWNTFGRQKVLQIDLVDWRESE